MPIYEYECRACGHRLETLQKISEAPLKACPHCGKPELRKLVSAAQFRLKGNGWYETDFKTDHRHHVLDGGDKAASAGAAHHHSETAAAANSSEPKPAKPAKPATSKSPESKKAAASGAP